MPTLPCPTCQKPVDWSAAPPWKPFCSERCKLLDLGAWLTEKHAIPGEEIADGRSGPGAADVDRDPPLRH
jgi:endogenous inhibitor of DNA gyrase (YacG/DUF329 family)